MIGLVLFLLSPSPHPNEKRSEESSGRRVKNMRGEERRKEDRREGS